MAQDPQPSCELTGTSGLFERLDEVDQSAVIDPAPRLGGGSAND
jgi:hypothetical protein